MFLRVDYEVDIKIKNCNIKKKEKKETFTNYK